MHSHIFRLGKPNRKPEPNILTWCADFRPFFPQSLPRFHPSDRRICAHRKEHTPYSAVSASGIHTPFLCTSRKKVRSRVPLYVNIFSIKSYTIEQLYTFILFCQEVNGIMAKTEAGGLFRCFCNKNSACFRKCFGEPSGIRTPGTLIKSLEKCMLYSYLRIFPLSKLRITIVFLSPVCNITVIYIWLVKSYFQHKC